MWLDLTELNERVVLWKICTRINDVTYVCLFGFGVVYVYAHLSTKLWSWIECFNTFSHFKRALVLSALLFLVWFAFIIYYMALPTQHNTSQLSNFTFLTMWLRVVVLLFVNCYWVGFTQKERERRKKEVVWHTYIFILQDIDQKIIKQVEE